MREIRFERNRLRRVRHEAPLLNDGEAEEPSPDAIGAETDAPDSRDRVEARGKKRSAAREILETLLLAAIIFVGVRSVLLNYRVDGASMQPNLQNGEMLIVNRRAYSHFDLNKILNIIPGVSRPEGEQWYPFARPARGDIVVLDPPIPSNEPYIKRIIGLPGETVSIHDGSVYIDGKKLEEGYLRSATNWRGFYAGDYTVEPGHVFVLGDNRNNSSDSRVFGTIPISSIIGKAWIAYWPPGEVKILSDPAYAMD